MPGGLRWSWCNINNNGNKYKINVIHLNHAETMAGATILVMEKLSSTKPVPGARKDENHCSIPSWVKTCVLVLETSLFLRAYYMPWPRAKLWGQLEKTRPVLEKLYLVSIVARGRVGRTSHKKKKKYNQHSDPKISCSNWIKSLFITSNHKNVWQKETWEMMTPTFPYISDEAADPEWAVTPPGSHSNLASGKIPSWGSSSGP